MYDIIMPIGDYQEITSLSIRSALNQTIRYSNFIFIIDTITEVEADKIKNKLKDIKRATIIRTQRIGQGKARQVGLDACKSEFIAFLDYDDIWHPRKIEIQTSKLKKDNSDFSFCSYRAINIDKKRFSLTFIVKEKISLLNLYICCPIGVSTVVCRRKLFNDRMQLSHALKRWDYITWFKLWKNFSPKQSICSDYLAFIIKRSSSISSSYWTSSAGYSSMQKAFRLLGFSLLNSFIIAFFYSSFQIPVKIKRLLFKYFLKSSRHVKDYPIGYYLKN